MEEGALFGGYAGYHLGNYALAVLMYLLLARFFLSLFFLPESRAVIWTVTRQITDPVLLPVRFITPRFVVEKALPLVAIFWVIVLRLLFWIVMTGAGLAPQL
ncbi:YggT family protein [Tepidicaulis sp. LMO-SS28]|uniref:YggT family protein n=1 Tax=Tepidicaulis sp. LMO-SS28 TaxID=3447455 RepID=UPI003EDEE966